MTRRQDTKSELPNYGLSLQAAGAAIFSVIASAHVADKKSDDLRMAGFKGMCTWILCRSTTLMLALVLIGVSGIFYSTELDKVIDFTYPTLSAGLRIMVRDRGVDNGAPFRPLHDWLTLSRSIAAEHAE